MLRQSRPDENKDPFLRYTQVSRIVPAGLVPAERRISLAVPVRPCLPPAGLSRRKAGLPCPPARRSQ